MKVPFKAALLVTGSLALVALLPVRARTNPPVVPGRTIEATLDVPPNVDAVLKRACLDCHSYETRWPWYSNIAPASWMIASDVQRARSAVNFSDWAVQAGRKRTTAMGALAAACEGAKIGRMPPPAYRLLHSDASLSAADVDLLCDWSVTQMRQMNPRVASIRHAPPLTP